MKTNIKATNMVLTGAIRDYLEEKLIQVDKLIHGKGEAGAMAQVEIGKESKHHKHGEVFRAEINLHLDGKTFRSVANASDLYAAIDEMKDEVLREIKTGRSKQNALNKRGGRIVKKILKGN